MNSKTSSFKPDLYVVARIIKVLIESGPMNRTRLSTYSNLSYDKFIIYLEWLKEKSLLTEKENLISVSPEGVKTYDRLVKWIIEYVGKLRFNRKI